MLRTSVYVALVGAACVVPAKAQSLNYTFKIFEAEKVTTTIIGRNNRGDRLIEREPIRGPYCVLVQGSMPTKIIDPKGTTTCSGLSRSGGVVGFYSNVTGMPPYTGFAYINGIYADVVPPQANPLWGSTVDAISPNGLMAGTYLASDNSYPIFVTYGSTFNTVRIDGVEILFAEGINDQGVLVAQGLFPGMRGDSIITFLIKDGNAIGLSFPGSTVTLGHAINNNEDIVGNYYDQAGVQHGFVYSSKKQAYFGPVDPPNATSVVLYGIDDDGVVTGSASFPESTVSKAIVGFPAGKPNKPGY